MYTVPQAIMALVTHVGRFEHHVDLGARSQRFSLTIDLIDVAVAGLLTFVIIRVLRRVQERAQEDPLTGGGPELRLRSTEVILFLCFY